MEIRTILGSVAVAVGLIGYIPYIRDIFAGRTKPHAFSWFIWGLLTLIGFLAQVADNAGPGAWITGFSAFVCLWIFILALQRGEKQIVALDWLSFFSALLALLLWFFTQTPLYSVILITLIDVLGSVPTIRKSINKPQQETRSAYFLSGLKFFIALFALSNFSIITWLYPISLVIQNWAILALLTIRRKQLGIV